MTTVSTPTMVDVARAAGVAVGTVSNFLNHPDRVAEGTRRKVQEAIDALGFVRNESARQLRAGRSRTVGLVVLDVANPFFTDVARGVEAVAGVAGLSVVLCDSNESEEREAAYLDLLREQRVHGVLITPVHFAGGRLDALRATGIPVVLVDQRSHLRGLCSVSVDDTLGGQVAAEHLLERGHRRIAFAGGPTSMRQVGERLLGARQAVAAAGCDDDVLTVMTTTGLNVESGREVGRRLVALGAEMRPTAVFCANDLLALGLLQELTRAGLRVPEDVALVGYDDIVFAEAAAVPISSVRQPRQHLGRTAMELLLEESRNPDHGHRQVEFDPELVVRQSSDFAR
jgi:LacI family transcriptional regulator